MKLEETVNNFFNIDLYFPRSLANNSITELTKESLQGLSNLEEL